MYQLKIISEIKDLFDYKYVESSFSFSKNGKIFDISDSLSHQKNVYQNVIVHQFENLEDIDEITIRWDFYKELKTPNKQIFDIVVDSIIHVFHISFPEKIKSSVFILNSSSLDKDEHESYNCFNGCMSLYGNMETVWNSQENMPLFFISKDREDRVRAMSKQVFGDLPAEVERNIKYHESNVILHNCEDI